MADARIEAGKRLPDVVELENLARLYGKPLGWFATWGTQLKSDTHEFGLGNDVGLTDGEFHERVQQIKAARVWRMSKNVNKSANRANRGALYLWCRSWFVTR